MDSFQIWIKDAIAKALRALASRDSIRIETATRRSLITICNWDKYQEESGVNATPMRQESDTSATQDGRQPDLIGEIENKRISIACSHWPGEYVFPIYLVARSTRPAGSR